MKRLLITTLIIGVVVAIVAGALHASKFIAGFELAAAQLVSDYTGATRIIGEKWQYVFVLLVALGVAWLSLSIVPRWRSRLLIGLLLVELFGLSCSIVLPQRIILRSSHGSGHGSHTTRNPAFEEKRSHSARRHTQGRSLQTQPAA